MRKTATLISCVLLLAGSLSAGLADGSSKLSRATLGDEPPLPSPDHAARLADAAARAAARPSLSRAAPDALDAANTDPRAIRAVLEAALPALLAAEATLPPAATVAIDEMADEEVEARHVAFFEALERAPPPADAAAARRALAALRSVPGMDPAPLLDLVRAELSAEFEFPTGGSLVGAGALRPVGLDVPGASPSASLTALMALFGVAPTADELRLLAQLDASPEPLRSALAAGFDATLAMNLAMRTAFGGLDPARLEPLADAPELLVTARYGTFVERLLDAGLDSVLADTAAWAGVAAARLALLKASLDLRAAWKAVPDGIGIDVPMGFPTYIGMITPTCYVSGIGTPGSDFWALDVIFGNDPDGSDVYVNNAGGSTCRGLKDCNFVPLAQVHIDVKGSDAYVSNRGCGINGGGGLIGAGLLVDVGGTPDVYVARSVATNGGSFLIGLGMIFELGGDDYYQAKHAGTNGGASLVAVSVIWELGGNDHFTAGVAGTNGGASTVALAHIVDLFGDDRLKATHGGTNGGATVVALGSIQDLDGSDERDAGSFGTNGGAYLYSEAWIEDDALFAASNHDDTYTAGMGGTNGGAGYSAIGTLIDVDGTDIYTAKGWGTNGGGHQGGEGSLRDEGGADNYLADGDKGVNGGAHAGGVGVLTDVGEGHDRYKAGSYGANGGASGAGSLGRLYDRTDPVYGSSGNDRYEAGDHGVNGGAEEGGDGTLEDDAGDDVYRGGSHGVNGGAYGGATTAWGSLIDRDVGGASPTGHDEYHGRDHGVNGGGSLGGIGSLEDAIGSDFYGCQACGGTAGSHGVNGGASGLASVGVLIDHDVAALGRPANDRYESYGSFGVNGGAYGEQAVGSLLDEGGADYYYGVNHGVNGGGSLGGSGSLIDQGSGKDQYFGNDFGTNGGAYGTTPYVIGGPAPTASLGFLEDQSIPGFPSGDDEFHAAYHGVNGGGASGGRGWLRNDAGSDRYGGASYGVNGGAHEVDALAVPSEGFLYDLDGNDNYTGLSFGVNGGASHRAEGHLRDNAGDDGYVTPRLPDPHFRAGCGINGGGCYGGRGTLRDYGAGRDYYAGGPFGVNGGAYQAQNGINSVGELIDHGGRDTYLATFDGANGGAFNLGDTGALLDLGGQGDWYSDNEGGTGWDVDVLAKESLFGEQCDSPC